MIIGLDHVQLAMPTGSEAEERAVAFYAGLLGFEIEEKPEPLRARGGCWFSAGTCKLHLGVEDGGFRPQKEAHPAFLSGAIGQLAENLEAGGYPVTWDAMLPDRKRFYVQDPFGNRIEILRRGDGFSERSIG